ncbi:MAG: prepilin-type N-terminal cleavage/methylation domain-containing protein [Phycisphaerae bacterium]|nr:type II secretion system protein [Tepidisphaeraceae bacterium]
MTPFTAQRRRHPARARGFTLVEAAITTVIIGVGCVALLELLGAGTVANKESAQLTTAMNLAGNVREAMSSLYYSDPTASTHWGPETGETAVSAFDDLDDFDGWSSSPGNPIDARRARLSNDYAAWAQSIKVESINPANLQATISHLTLAPDQRPTCRVTVTVSHHGHTVYTQTWIAAYADPSSP